MASGATAPAGGVAVPAFMTSTVGQKLVMAVTGLILFGFLIVHMLGNLQVYMGAEAFNGYSHFLHTLLHGQALWIARAVLLGSVLLHIWAAITLWRRSRAARPIGYQQLRPRESNYASRTMRLSGLIVIAFVVYHLLDLTFGTVNPDFVDGDVYHNFVASFRVLPVAGLYLLANVCLGFHLYHGSWSFMQTLGLNHPRYNPLRNRLAIGIAMLVVVGNLSFPIAVLAGAVR
jgi:succinate dehydrogenase / fumarate reductase cytochrome b subunit